MVKLICNGEATEFDEQVAQNILQIQAHQQSIGVILDSVYQLPEDSQYEFTGNGLGIKPDKGNSKKTTKQANTKPVD